MYGTGLTMFLAMLKFQLPLLQTIVLPSRPNQEATTMDKANFSTIRPSNRQKGDLQQSTSCGPNQETPSIMQSRRHSFMGGMGGGNPPKDSSSFSSFSNEGKDGKKGN
jgi:hypothetical protein